jgi:hypothetical protein
MRRPQLIWVITEFLNCSPLVFLHQMKVTMTELDLTNREDPRLQADPVLILSDGRATFGQKLFCGIAAIVVVLGTLYGLVQQHGETPQSRTILAISGAVLPETVGHAK